MSPRLQYGIEMANVLGASQAVGHVLSSVHVLSPLILSINL